MQTYKDVVATYKEKNSKTPKTTWRYESWGDSYEQGERVGYQSGQLVQPGLGRQGYSGRRKGSYIRSEEYAGRTVITEKGAKLVKLYNEGYSANEIAKQLKYNRKTILNAIKAINNPDIDTGTLKFKSDIYRRVNKSLKNLKDPKVIERIQAIADANPTLNKEELKKKGLITDKESRIKSIKFGFKGKHWSDEGRKRANLKRKTLTKARSNIQMEEALAALRKSGLQFSHLALNELTSLQNTGYLPKDINIKSYHKFEKKVVDIAKQIKEAQDNKKFSIPERRNKIAELQKEDRALRKQFPEYAKTKARLVTKATSLDSSGIMIKEKLLDPKIAISQEPGTQLKGLTPKSEKGKEIIKMGKKSFDDIIQNNLSDFCPKQKVALGGRIGFAGTCTPQQILDNMKKDQQLLIEYKKGAKNISSAEAAKIAQKFTNASGKVLKLGLKGARFMFGPAMLWGEPLIEGALIAYDMKVEKTPFKQAAAKSFLTAPLRAMNLMKESEEYEAESLFQKKDNREFVYFDGKEIKNPNFGKVTGVIPGVKAYTDARNKLMRINDLRFKMKNMQEEAKSGTTLGSVDAVEFLRKKLSKELSDIRYDEKSLQKIMKKNEPEYNIAVEKLRAKRFKDVDPYVPDEGDPIGPILDVTGNKRYQEMADLNRGYLQGDGVFGNYISPEKYEEIKLGASQPSEYQAFYQMMKKQVDNMGGPGFEPYKKILNQPGFGGPANQYTYGQMTTPADRYYLDRTGKIAEKGSLQFAGGGRVSFKGGGIDKGRRAFMKLLAALGIGTAGAKSGISLFGKATTKTAVKTGVDIATGTPGMPSWFPTLVNKIIKEGDDVTAKIATQERQVVHTKKLPDGESATVYRDLDTGDIRVEYDSVDIMGEGAVGPVQMEYKAGQVIDEGKMAGKKTKSEFSAAESEPRYEMVGPDDAEVNWDSSNIVGNVDDLMSDTTKLKNYAQGKKPTLKEIVTSKRKTDEVTNINKDTSAQVDYSVNKYGEGDYASGGRVSYFDGGIVSLKKKW